MASLESLPPDQRAVLQLVLQRGRTYDEIAAMLSIDRAAVRDRALSAFDALGPPTRVTPERRALITDYLMGQLPPRVAEQIFERLRTSPAERAWARSLASDLSTLANGPLPDIPSSVDSMSAPAQPAAAPTVVDTVPASAAGAADAEEAEQAEEAEEAPAPRPRRRPAGAPTAAPTVAQRAADDQTDAGYGRRDEDTAGEEYPPSSRRGGAIMILGAVLVAAAIVVVLIILTNNGGSSRSPSGSAVSPPAGTGTGAAPAATSTPTSATSTPTSASSTPTGTSASGATTPAAGTTGASGTTGAQLVAQLDLKAPSGATSPVGVAQIVKQSGKEGIVLVATGVTPNTTHNAYAVWLYKAPSHSKLLGFVNPAVKSNGRLETVGPLPANAAGYNQVLVTLETQPKPTGPGTVILRGPLSIK